MLHNHVLPPNLQVNPDGFFLPLEDIQAISASVRENTKAGRYARTSTINGKTINYGIIITDEEKGEKGVYVIYRENSHDTKNPEVASGGFGKIKYLQKINEGAEKGKIFVLKTQNYWDITNEEVIKRINQLKEYNNDEYQKLISAIGKSKSISIKTIEETELQKYEIDFYRKIYLKEHDDIPSLAKNEFEKLESLGRARGKLWKRGTKDPFLSKYEFISTYVPGQNVKEFIKKRPTLPLEQVKECILKISQKIKELHDKEMVHADINESNVFLNETNREISSDMLDFGFSQNLSYQTIQILDPEEKVETGDINTVYLRRISEKNPDTYIVFYYKSGIPMSERCIPLETIPVIHRKENPTNFDFFLNELGLKCHREEIQLHKGWGTPAYESPEILKSKTYSKASDIYAFGKLIAFYFLPYFDFWNRKPLEILIREMCQSDYTKRPNIDKVIETISTFKPKPFSIIKTIMIGALFGGLLAIGGIFLGPMGAGIGIGIGVWLGSSLGGVTGGVAINLMGYFADFYKKHKKIIMGAMVLAAVIVACIFSFGIAGAFFGVSAFSASFFAPIGGFFGASASTSLASAVGAVVVGSFIPVASFVISGIVHAFKKLKNWLSPRPNQNLSKQTFIEHSELPEVKKNNSTLTTMKLLPLPQKPRKTNATIPRSRSMEPQNRRGRGNNGTEKEDKFIIHQPTGPVGKSATGLLGR